MALSEAQRKANDNYIKEHYQRLAISYPKEFCQLVREAAEANGESLAGFVRKAIEDRIKRNGTTQDEGIPPALLAYQQQQQQKIYEQRKAIIDATSYCGSNCAENPVWKDRTK